MGVVHWKIEEERSGDGELNVKRLGDSEGECRERHGMKWKEMCVSVYQALPKTEQFGILPSSMLITVQPCDHASATN